MAIKEIYTLLNCKDSEQVPLAPLLSLGLYLEVKTKYNNLNLMSVCSCIIDDMRRETN